ncbi:hypothetical protein SAY86_025649 [Trapa natans]|uniref:Major facilitator superfamily (MFS) profile domain-containing protein n=1 Tax=Trapa natans TaxID=22666 RepID=A0AAN7KCF5_TRANT|nr:hypothetical protein SAY86_025649 [Trapa natans]
MEIQDSPKNINSKSLETNRTRTFEKQGEVSKLRSSDHNEEEKEKPDRKPPSSGSSEMAMRTPTLVEPPTNPSWFTPKRLRALRCLSQVPVFTPPCVYELRFRFWKTRDAIGLLLIIFCVINMLNYVDRGAIASNGVNGSREVCNASGVCTSGTGIQGNFDLNNFEDGVLSSAFMVGLLIASPIFASLAKSINPFRLIGVGLSVWTLATAGCGVSFSFSSIATCRMLVGVGEASFISLAAPFIDDNAPVAQKTVWLAMFYMCIPTGVALGYVYGGFVGNHFNWRYAFWGEALLMFPFAVLGFVMKPLQLKGFTPVGSKKATSVVTADAVSEVSNMNGSTVGDEDLSHQPDNKASKSSNASGVWFQFSRFLEDMKALHSDKVYVINVLGYVAYNFVIGAYSYWGPKAGYNIYHMESADMMFGGITILCGLLGTLAGGFILDRMSATISNAFKLLSGATFLGAVACFIAFCTRSLYGFIVLFSVGELLVFATQAPVNFVCLHCVKPSLRPLSMAMSTVSIHIFGDVPSSPLVGVLQVRTFPAPF